ncbi:hypothetical protein JQC67_15225 [Aurantibacter crassamenti]|uniref:hypothetical protein n=1 Tax=Aurantibacter crassamenti TaxID=1837375 RepID=UPI00193A0B5C|nr:hypothetical protein [Aurantibacter crassamenti]MBM1107505.1 hypothetical protein [Aurantibacter crassamenti]
MSMPTDYSEFQDSLLKQNPPSDWPEGLQALWFDAKDDWESSHNIAQDMHNRLGSWIHAYLHRKEGDEFNAGYWYRQAGKPFSKLTLADELQEIVEFVLLS